MRRLSAVATLVGLVTAAGCSAGSSAPAADGSGGTAGSGATAGGTSGMLFGSSGGAGGGIMFDRACASETQKGEPLPLTMYVMMDTSGSMLDLTTSGVTKWEAVANAFARFLSDPRSAGISVGLQFFPLLRPGVPLECTTHADCGVGAPCTSSFCNRDSDVVICLDASDCQNRLSQCAPMGRCAGDDRVVCELGTSCGGPLGACQDWTGKWCVNGTYCEASDYATPAVPFTSLPGGADALVQAMVDRTDFARTPTGPALAGAIDGAKGWAGSHPDDTVITVLATDGLPTECAPTDIASVAQIAADGLSGAPSIETFVIGVFAPTDVESPANLDQIAQAGGTNSAFIVDTSGDVSQQFIDALDSIRGAALSCEFQIPAPGAGQQLDFNFVNLVFTEGDTQRPLANVVDQAGCARATDGWYYDVDPSTGGTPSRITVCPNVCQAFKTSPSGQVDLLIGCQTVIR